MERDRTNVSFQIECLDHVALRVKDLDLSRKWYESVLGLKAYQLEEWGEIPVFLLAGTTGIALFPADLNLKRPNPSSKHVKIDHFAFRLDNENFERAKKRYSELMVEYQFQDHHYFHSIYTKDPDGHTVELTTIMVDKSTFYTE